MLRLLALALVAGLTSAQSSLPDPLFAAYWGQSAEGSLSSYCYAGHFNVISIAFVSGFGAIPFTFTTDGCQASAYSGTGSCSALGQEILACQAVGVKILVSYGGATAADCGASAGCTGNYYFDSASQAQSTATQAWQMFFNNGQVTDGVARPFGPGVTLDGLDLDIEVSTGGAQLHYDSFVNTLKGFNSNLIIGAAPECQYGDLGVNPLAIAVTNTPIDFLFVQFFNNPKCDVRSPNFAGAFGYWVAAASANPNGATRVLVGLPGNNDGSSLSAEFYLSPSEALSNVANLRGQYPNAHVGVGVWDAGASTGSTPDPAWAENVANGLRNLNVVAVVSTPSSSSSSLSAPASSSTSTTSSTTATVAPSTLASVVANATSTTSSSTASTSSRILTALTTPSSPPTAAPAATTSSKAAGALENRQLNTVVLPLGIVAMMAWFL